jgi:simple sugar transport system substrate-binding protein
MTKRKLAAAAVLLTAVALAAALAVGTGSGSAKPSVFKAAWIYVGPHNDGGWSQAHDQGRLAVQKALGDKVDTTSPKGRRSRR